MYKTKLIGIYYVILLLAITALWGCSSAEQGPPADTKPEKQIAVSQQKHVNNPTALADKPEKNAYNPVTGEYLFKLGKPVAVMVDNLRAARPQSGLASADVVYEAEVEGCITRFMAIFYGNNPSEVGPVRSARPYFLRLVKPWDCHYVHVGGSEKAYADIPRLGIKNIDSMRGDPGFTTDESRRAPHNIYIDLGKALKHKKINLNPPGWAFGDSPATPDYFIIKLSYSGSNQPGYVWDGNKRVYTRTINGQPHLDKVTGKPITVNNIVIQYARHIFSGDSLGHIDIVTEGSGKAEYFLGGKHLKGTWHRTRGGHIKYLDEAGKPVSMVPGNTWIQIVRPGTKVHLANDK